MSFGGDASLCTAVVVSFVGVDSTFALRRGSLASSASSEAFRVQQELRETKGMLEQLDVKISCLGKDLVVLGSDVRTVLAAMKELFPVAFNVKQGCPATVDGLPSNTVSDDLIQGPYDCLANAFVYQNPFSQDNSRLLYSHNMTGQNNSANATYSNLFSNTTTDVNDMSVPLHPPACPIRSIPRLRTVPNQASSFDEGRSPYDLDACDVPSRSLGASADPVGAPERLPLLQPRLVANRRKASLPFCPELSRKVVGSRRVSHSTTDILSQTRQMGGGYSENRAHGLEPTAALRSAAAALDTQQASSDWNAEANFSTTNSCPPLKFLTTDL